MLRLFIALPFCAVSGARGVHSGVGKYSLRFLHCGQNLLKASNQRNDCTFIRYLGSACCSGVCAVQAPLLEQVILSLEKARTKKPAGCVMA